MRRNCHPDLGARPDRNLRRRTDCRWRGKGYGSAVVSAATAWTLAQGEAPVYAAYANNIPSLRIARRLGFSLLQQSMGV